MVTQTEAIIALNCYGFYYQMHDEVFDLPHMYCSSLDKNQWHPTMQYSTAGFYIIVCSTISVRQKDLILVQFTFPGKMIEKSQ